MQSMLRIEEVLLHNGATALFVESFMLGALTIPLPEVDAFCAALQAKAQAVREEADVRAERGAREEAPGEETWQRCPGLDRTAREALRKTIEHSGAMTAEINAERGLREEAPAEE
jgi:hypothetical protein